MKTFAIVSALAAVGLVSASPTPTEQQKPNKRASLPTVTASGNGKLSDIAICDQACIS